MQQTSYDLASGWRRRVWLVSEKYTPLRTNRKKIAVRSRLRRRWNIEGESIATHTNQLSLLIVIHEFLLKAPPCIYLNITWNISCEMGCLLDAHLCRRSHFKNAHYRGVWFVLGCKNITSSARHVFNKQSDRIRRYFQTINSLETSMRNVVLVCIERLNKRDKPIPPFQRQPPGRLPYDPHC